MNAKTSNIFSLKLAAFAAALLAVALGAAPLAAQTVAADDAIMQDVNLRQVAIEALVIEVNQARARDVGINYTFNRREDYNPNSILEGVDTRLPGSFDRVEVPVFSDVGELGGFAIAQVARQQGIGTTLQGMDLGNAGRISADIRALLQQGVAEVRTRPIAIALNNTPVKIETVDKIPYQDVTYPKGVLALTTAEKSVGVKLHVTPRIIDLEKQTVELDLQKIEVSGISSYITVKQVNRPIFVSSEAKAKVVLHNSETLVVAGLKQKRESVSESRVPFLGRIPLLGRLFKSERKEHRTIDVLFFVTPYILPPGRNCILPFDFEHGEVLNARPGDPE